jgi:transposase-like protein
MWWITNQKSGVSALGLQRLLGLRSYQTAWAWLHKLRRAMVRPGRDQLSGEVEVDETFVGGPGAGCGRHVGNKALVAIAVEIRGQAMGRIRMRRVADSSGESLCGFVHAVVVPGATVQTDGFASYLGLSALGYGHDPKIKLGSTPTDEPRLPRVHRVASLLKRWLLGTHQGGVSREHLDYYLDEFTFRFNRRRSRSRGLLFHRLVQQAALADPTPYGNLVACRRRPKHKMLGQPESNG